MAEYPDSTAHLGRAHPDPKLSHWPDPNQSWPDPNQAWLDPNPAWPDLNTTRCRNMLALGSDGSVGVFCAGRRPITTSDAFQAMFTFAGGQLTWSAFVRVNTPDLANVRSTSLLPNPWDGASANEANAVVLTTLLVDWDGVALAGCQDTLESADAVPVTYRPVWLEATPAAVRSGLLARLATEPGDRPERLFDDGFEAR